MQQHTGQHLLSAVFLRELNIATVSFHLGDSVSTIDLSGGPIAHHSLERIERLCNEIIAEDRAVSTRNVPRAEAESMLAAGQLRKLPERAGDIRLIEINDIDRNACGGTHVSSTGQIGALLLRGTEKVSRGVRVQFVCGLRAVQAARADAAILSQLTTMLSAGAADVPAAVERLKNESKNTAKERQRLREELADYHASRLAVEVHIEDGLRIVDRSWKDRDPEYCKLLASRLTSAAPSTIVLFSRRAPLPRPSSSRAASTSTSTAAASSEKRSPNSGSAAVVPLTSHRARSLPNNSPRSGPRSWRPSAPRYPNPGNRNPPSQGRAPGRPGSALPSVTSPVLRCWRAGARIT
jgi:alanyl-tRNA synthetase